MRVNEWDYSSDQKMQGMATKDRELQMCTPCECGCDERDGVNLGYISYAKDWKGFSIVAEDQDDKLQLESALAGGMDAVQGLLARSR